MREMKDSGIKWMGSIPSPWFVERVKHGFIRKKMESHQEKPIVLSLARAGIKERDISNNEGQIAESYYNYNPVTIDDLLINPMDLYSGANCSISKIEGVISPAYINLRYLEGHNPNYYDYYFKIQYWMMAFFAHGKGVSFENRWTLNADTLMNYPIITPPYEEQCRIVDYLNDKCVKIDSIIEKQQLIVEKLKEYKLSIITEAVTKGLNPNVEMKDSGVEWIGEIPINWETGKTLYALSMPITDGPHETPELFDEGIPFVSAEAVSCGNGHIDFEHIRGYISQDFYNECCKKYIPQINDVYMIKSGATTGKVAKVETDNVFTIWSPLAVFRVDDTKYYYEYLYYFIQSDGYQKQIENKWTYGTQQNIGMRTLEKLFLCFPSLNEQKQIANYLDDKCAKIDFIIEKQQAIIEKLKEYKKSLIYEVVTGKKEI